MTCKSLLIRSFTKCVSIVFALALTLFTNSKAWSQPTVPFTVNNNSAYTDANVYVAVVGIINGNHVWIDTKTSAVHLMSASDNTVAGPVIGGNNGPTCTCHYHCWRFCRTNHRLFNGYSG